MTDSKSRLFRLRKQQHLRTSQEFEAVYAARNRRGDDHLLVFGLPNTRGYSRFGLSVSRKHGHAVRRARKKRLLREAFRLLQHELPTGWDWVLIPRTHPRATLADFMQSLRELTARLQRSQNRDSTGTVAADTRKNTALTSQTRQTADHPPDRSGR